MQSSENSQVLWPLKPKEINGTVIQNSNCGSTIGRPEGRWPSPSLNFALNLFQDLSDDSKTFSARSIPSSYNASLSSRPNSGLLSDQDEKGKPNGASVGCWLFGINLTSNSKPTAPLDVSCPSICTSSVKGPVSVVPEADRIQNLDAPKSLNEQKQVVPDASQKETQRKQSCTPSSRTRTKVKAELCELGAGSFWIFKCLNLFLRSIFQWK